MSLHPNLAKSLAATAFGGGMIFLSSDLGQRLLQLVGGSDMYTPVDDNGRRLGAAIGAGLFLAGSIGSFYNIARYGVYQVQQSQPPAQNPPVNP